MHRSVLIIGGGISGLALARALHRDGVDFALLEGRGRFGGRIETQIVAGQACDLGPAWVWPGQPLVAALLRDLGLRVFEQYASGALSYEDETGTVQRGRGFASMEGSWRVMGGLGALTDALVADLPAEALHLNCPVTELHQTEAGLRALGGDDQIFTADQVVLALPPRIAAELRFDPPLGAAALSALSAVPSWMAGQAKTLALYDSPFWRSEGLSGDAMSRMGPMVEIHDASPADGAAGALFGFIGVTPAARRDEATLKQQICAQLGRLFGPRAAAPDHLILRDWAAEPFTATAADHAPLAAHPVYGLPAALRDLWQGRLILSGTETAAQSGGYIEGALEAAAAALTQIRTHRGGLQNAG